MCHRTWRVKSPTTPCAFSKTFKILDAMTDSGIFSHFSHFSHFSLFFSSGSNSMVDFSTCPPLTLTLAPPPEPVYRTAEKEWITFIESLTDLLIQVDPQIPPLPPKDLIHRIYRDVISFLSRPSLLLLTCLSRFALATTRPPTSKPFLPPFQEQAERVSLPVASLFRLALTYLFTPSIDHMYVPFHLAHPHILYLISASYVHLSILHPPHPLLTLVLSSQTRKPVHHRRRFMVSCSTSIS